MPKARRDIQAEITQKIVSLIDEHGANWTKPFSELSGVPTNAVTGARYRGMNAFWLGLLGKTYVASYKQWQSVGAQVRGGEKGIAIMVPMPIKDKETDEFKGTYFKAATVFSSEQVDGWTPPAVPQVDQTTVLDGVDAFVAATGADIRVSPERGCYYSPVADYIHMLHREQFEATETSTATASYYSTLLHELVHWTGHPSRNDRIKLVAAERSEYAFEELVAEIGAAILCAELGVTAEVRADHAQYVAGWLRALRSDKKFIFQAAAQAQKAVDFLFSIQEQEAAA